MRGLVLDFPMILSMSWWHGGELLLAGNIYKKKRISLIWTVVIPTHFWFYQTNMNSSPKILNKLHVSCPIFLSQELFYSMKIVVDNFTKNFPKDCQHHSIHSHYFLHFCGNWRIESKQQLPFHFSKLRNTRAKLPIPLLENSSRTTNQPLTLCLLSTLPDLRKRSVFLLIIVRNHLNLSNNPPEIVRLEWIYNIYADDLLKKP